MNDIIQQEQKVVLHSMRDSYLDIVRGIVVLGIVFIHTCFWSGTDYVPFSIQQFSLICDVPAFLFISGMTYAVIKKEMIVGAGLKLMLSFAFIAFLYDLFFLEWTFPNVIKSLFLAAPHLEKLMVVGGSYWFVPMFIPVLFFGTVFLTKLKSISFPLMILLFLYYPVRYFYPEVITPFQTLGLSSDILFFYLALFLLGFFVREKVIFSSWQKLGGGGMLISAVAALFILFLFKGDIIFNFQENKFPVRLPYVLFSFISVSFIIFFYSHSASNKSLEHIGQNAIYYYVAQGCGASILFYLLPYFKWAWYLKLPLFLGINLLITVICAEFFRIAFVKLRQFQKRYYLEIQAKKKFLKVGTVGE